MRERVAENVMRYSSNIALYHKYVEIYLSARFWNKFHLVYIK